SFSTTTLPSWAVTSLVPQEMTVARLPVVSLLLGLCGIVALVSMSVLLSNLRIGESIRWCGAHSIVIYLAFFLPMATTRTVLLKLGIIPDVGTVSLLVWLAAVIGPVVLFVLIQRLGIGRFLFVRPQWARMQPVRN
ncbi:MAG: acyltransferase, partial [Pseudomonadota bacterium]